jgi:hypothetical protein
VQSHQALKGTVLMYVDRLMMHCSQQLQLKLPLAFTSGASTTGEVWVAVDLGVLLLVC